MVILDEGFCEPLRVLGDGVRDLTVGIVWDGVLRTASDELDKRKERLHSWTSGVCIPTGSVILGTPAIILTNNLLYDVLETDAIYIIKVFDVLIFLSVSLWSFNLYHAKEKEII